VDLVLAPLTPADVAEVVVLQRACWLPEGIANGSMTIPPLVETADDVLAAAARCTWLVGRAGHRLVAGVRGQRVGDDWEIGRLMVAPDLAGQGLGRRLLTEIESRAPAGVRRFVLFTGAASERNIRIYRRAGYTPIPSPPGSPDGVVHLAREVTPRRG
jgi:GNAT superfamily N-acetyltransferase